MSTNDYNDTRRDELADDYGTNFDDASTMYVEEGWDVIGADGEKIGSIAQASDTFFVVSKGFLFPTDRYIPFSTVTRVEDEKVFLNLSKDEIDARGWDDPNVVRDLEYGRTGTGTSYVDSEIPAGRQSIANSDYTTDPAVDDNDITTRGTTTSRRDTVDDNDVRLHKERLTADKTRAETGAVRVGKEVESHQESIDVPVEREEVDVEYTQYDSPRAASGEITNEDQEIRVPVTEEDVVARKETVATGEVNVDKRRVRDTKRVTGEVREERPVIEREGDVDVNTKGTDTDDVHPH